MSRMLVNHKVGNVPTCSIRVEDEPGPGGANHRYYIDSEERGCTIIFQKGGVKEVGINGATNEALLAIVEDRLLAFQSGPFACDHNKLALLGVQVALKTLKERTVERLSRGVEGCQTP